MKMKYFRFLYWETGQCFLHFGELQDTMKEETYTFLYLRKAEKHVEQAKSGHRLFLLPRHVNFAILGSSDGETLCVLKELLKDTEIDTLLLGDEERSAVRDELPGVGKVVRLTNGTYQSEVAGWRFLARSSADGTVAFAHGLSADLSEEVFEDCVMSVKAVRKGAPCQKELSPDGYGCALGCALYQDYDVCRYRGSDSRPTFGTGTLLFGGGDEAACRELLREAQTEIGEIRFFGLTADARTQMAVIEKKFADRIDASAEGFRRYLIGTEDTDDRTAAGLCRTGWNLRPVLLKEGEGICCSGLLKYTA